MRAAGRDDHELTSLFKAGLLLVLRDRYLSAQLANLVRQLRQSRLIHERARLVRLPDEENAGRAVLQQRLGDQFSDRPVRADNRNLEAGLEPSLTDHLQCQMDRAGVSMSRRNLINELRVTIKEQLAMTGGDLGERPPTD